MGLLAERGVRARVFNANASSLLGEIPVESSLPQVWVERPDEAQRARRLIDEFLRAPAGAESRKCPNCSEDNPASFDLCWSCGAGLEGC